MLKIYFQLYIPWNLNIVENSLLAKLVVPIFCVHLFLMIKTLRRSTKSLKEKCDLLTEFTRQTFHYGTPNARKNFSQNVIAIKSVLVIVLLWNTNQFGKDRLSCLSGRRSECKNSKHKYSAKLCLFSEAEADQLWSRVIVAKNSDNNFNCQGNHWNLTPSDEIFPINYYQLEHCPAHRGSFKFWM